MRFCLAFLLVSTAANPEDWPEWRGRGRTGVWRETGILKTFPRDGLRFRWRSPLNGGYAGPAVAGGRVFVTDFRKIAATQGIERIVAIEESTGKPLWSQEWAADYRGLDYAGGPRATPTVDDGRVYALGAMGALKSLDARTGRVLWERDYVRDFGAEVPAWGMTSAPIVDGDRLIAVTAGKPEGKVIAFDKRTGREIWRALSSVDSEPGYSQPILIEAGGRRQLIVWHATAISSLDPVTGRILWEHPFRVTMNTPIATPAYHAPYLLVSGFFNGARLLRLDSLGAELVWKPQVESETRGDTLHSLMNSPVIDKGYIYGICAHGQLRCLRLDTGARVWESQAVTVEQRRNASAFVVRHGDRYFINNDRGELIIARFSSEGYREDSRTELIKPTSPGGRRERGAVNWSHPAYANGHIFARNDEEIVCASLLESAAAGQTSGQNRN
jgi:outer membrane protein assembly factor BamB